MAGCNLLTVAIITFCFTAVKSLEQCLLNRQDFLPCRFFNRTPRPGPNQFGVYETRLNTNVNPKTCRVRIRFEDESSQVRNITDLDGTLIVNSPGYTADPQQPYNNRLLGEYNLECGEGEAIYFELTSLELEPPNCFNELSNSILCQDYVELGLSNVIVDELCGSATNDDNTYLIPDNKLRIWFRTSEVGMFPGFRGYAVCIPTSNSQDVSRRSTCTETTLDVGRPPRLLADPPPFKNQQSSTTPPDQQASVFRRSLEQESPTETTSFEDPSLVEEVPTTPANLSNFYVPDEFRTMRRRKSPSERACLRPQFTIVQRNVTNRLVKALFFVDSVLENDGVMNTTDLSSEFDKFVATVRLAQVNVDSCNPVVAALSRSLLFVERRVDRADFREN